MWCGLFLYNNIAMGLMIKFRALGQIDDDDGF